MKQPLKFVALLCLAVLLQSCKSKVEQAYEACMDRVAKATDEAVGKTSASNEQEKAIADAAGTLLNTVGASTCGAIREQCREDEESPICQGLLLQFRE